MVPRGTNKITVLTAAVGLGKGLSNVSSVAVAAAGLGYRVNDILIAAGGTAASALTAKFKVNEVSDIGGVTDLEIANAGDLAGVYTAKPGNPVSTTGGTGTGCTLTIVWNDDAIPVGANFAELVSETQAVRLRDDGTDPTAAIGDLLAVGVPKMYSAHLSRARVIEAAASGALNVTFYK